MFLLTLVLILKLMLRIIRFFLDLIVYLLRSMF